MPFFWNFKFRKSGSAPGNLLFTSILNNSGLRTSKVGVQWVILMDLKPLPTPATSMLAPPPGAWAWPLIFGIPKVIFFPNSREFKKCSAFFVVCFFLLKGSFLAPFQEIPIEQAPGKSPEICVFDL